MKNCARFNSRFVVLAAASLWLWTMPGLGQPHFLQYDICVGSTESLTQNNTYDSGQVQGTNVLTTNLSGPGATCNATATPYVSYGPLSLYADCYLGSLIPGTGENARVVPGTGGGVDVNYQDTLTLSSSTLPSGTAAQVEVILGYGGSITPGVTSSDPNDGSSSSATVGISASGSNYTSAMATLGGSFETNFISVVVNSKVGGEVEIVSDITLYADVYNDDGNGSYPGCSVVGNVACQTYINVLTSGVTYTTASGVTYPAIGQPTLYIQGTGPGGTNAIVSWSALYSNYVLQQNPTLGTTNWISNTNTVTTSNGTNQVSVPLGGAAMFFRLAQP
jgi:hypothetical protein